MRKKKRSFRHFKYRECDAFAKYLDEQAAKGWYFKERRFGLAFEKGEPGKATYSVEVFPKGNEQDCRPEKDAEEFAEYCKAAGWELVDGWKKFCVFKAISKDTIPISEPEMRYENICKAEKERLYAFCWSIPLASFWGLSMWFDLYRFIFRNSAVFLAAILLFMSIASVGDALAAILWRRKKKQQLEIGEIPFYGKTIGVNYYGLVAVMLAGALILEGVETKVRSIYDISQLLTGNIYWIVVAFVALLASIFKPSIERRKQIELILWFVGIVGIGGLSIYSALHIEPDTTRETYAPLLSEDFKEVSGEPSISCNQSESVLGKRYEYYISYGEWGDDSVIYEQLRYTVCESPYEWVKNRLWKQREDWGAIWRYGNTGEKILPETTDCKALWGSEAAWVYPLDEHNAEKYCYEVRYPDKLMILRTMDELDEEDVRIIREKLKLD